MGLGLAAAGALLLVGASVWTCAALEEGSGVVEFVEARNGRLFAGASPYLYVGTNYWQCANLAAQDPGRVRRELDFLKGSGVTQVRLMGGSEGPDDAPWRVVPSIQPAPRVYNDTLLEGFDTCLAELSARGMRATVVLNNQWHWSGGFAQYAVWAKCLEAPECDVAAPGKLQDAVPYPGVPPPPVGVKPGAQWKEFVAFATRGFYDSDVAQALFRDHIAFMLGRESTVTGLRLADDPTVLTFQLANEPQSGAGGGGFASGENGFETAFIGWIRDTAAFIKSRAPRTLVSLGMEGNWNGRVDNHCAVDEIDICTGHVWPMNWGYWHPSGTLAQFTHALAFANEYIRDVVADAAALGKPVLLEEFGFPRDGGSLSPAATTNMRDRFFCHLMSSVVYSAAFGGNVAGVNFWAFAGEGRPKASLPTNWTTPDAATAGYKLPVIEQEFVCDPLSGVNGGVHIPPEPPNDLVRFDSGLVGAGFTDSATALTLRDNLRRWFPAAATVEDVLASLEDLSAVNATQQHDDCVAAYAGSANGTLTDAARLCLAYCYSNDAQRQVFCPPSVWWLTGDPLTGDPPHEVQGWYSVYDADTTWARVVIPVAAALERVVSELPDEEPGGGA